MPASVTVTERDRYTVAGLIRHFARGQPDARDARARCRSGAPGRGVRRRVPVAQAATRDGLGVGDRIAFLDRNGIAYFDFLFGGSLIGAVNVAVNWRLAPAEMAAIIDDSGAPVLAIHADYLPALSAMPSGLPRCERIVVLGDARAVRLSRPRARSFERGSRGARPRTPATSAPPTRSACSSTPRAPPGLPKGVMLTNANLSTAVGGGGRDVQHLARHREPGGHAAVPHRRVGMGALRDVARRDGRSSCATSTRPCCSS